MCTKCKLREPVSGKKFCIDCLEANRAYQRKWWQENRDRHRENMLKRGKDISTTNRRKIYDYLLAHPCVDCGSSDPRVLEFDHIRDKKYNVASMLGTYNIDTIFKEVEKCEVRCCNCHRIKTLERSGALRHLWYSNIPPGR